MTEYWFKPKRYGWGAAPTSWQGWLVVVGFTVVSLLIAWVFIVAPTTAGIEPSSSDVFWFLALEFLAAVALIYVCKVKTDGEWRWRWGSKE